MTKEIIQGYLRYARKCALRLLLCTPLVCFALTSSAKIESLQANIPNALFYDQYSYIIILDEEQQPGQLTDEEFFDKAAKIVFPVNSVELPTDNALLRHLEQTLIPHINSDSLQLVRMVFRGAASPEGSFTVNKQLGEQRVQSLYRFVSSRITAPLDEHQFSINADIEDYRSLCIMMRRAGDPDYQLVQSFCDEHLPLQEFVILKDKLQKAKGGQLWPRLLRQYFPDLRAARFVIYLKKYKPVEPVVPIAPVVPINPVKPATPDVQTPPPPVPEPVIPDTLYRRELLSIKTNLLFYGIYMPGYNRWCPIPNVAIEYYPLRGHFTFGASFDCPWWQNYEKHKYFQIRNYQLEARYYLKPAGAAEAVGDYVSYKAPAYSGFYLQAYTHLGLFGICFDADRGWVGEGIGAGLGLGYVVPLSKRGHWRMEFGLQAGYFRCKYDPYQYENPVNPDYRDGLYYYKWTQSPELFKERQYRWDWLGPTRIGITLTYDLLYRRIQKRGVSFKSIERRAAYEE